MNILGSAVDTWATVAVAIGTLGAVGYALFRDLIVTPRRRPKLDLRLDDEGHDKLTLPSGASVRMRVVNRPGKDTADEVVVVVTTLQRLGDGETSPVGVPLTWSGTSPPRTIATVHPGSQRHVDLLHCDTGSDALQLDLSPKPTAGHDELEAGSYEISVEVRARNADAIRYVIPVTWDGDWSGEIWEHLRVEAPRAIP